MALVFLAMSCESDGDGGDCLGSTDSLITGCSDGCGTGLTPIGEGCLGSCLLGGDGDGCGIGSGDGCMGDCLGDCMGDCTGDCMGDPDHYVFEGDHAEQAIQLQVTDSLFGFISANLMDIIQAAAGDALPIVDGKIAVCIPKDTNAEIITLCKKADTSGPCAGTGCKLDIEIGDLKIIPRAPDGLAIDISGVRANGDISASYSACDTAEIRTGGSGIRAVIGMRFRLNNAFPNNSTGLPHTELYIGGNDFTLSGVNNISMKTKCRDCKWYEEAGCFLGGWSANALVSAATGLIGSMIEDAIGALSCRGCDSNIDCGPGATCGNGGVCQYPGKPFGQVCEGIMIGADARIDAGSLLASIDPGAEGLFGLRAYLGNMVEAAPGRGITFAGRIGAVAPEPSLCVPTRPSPIVRGKQSCRDGEFCPKLAELNGGGIITNPANDQQEAFHIGLGVGMGGLNHVLWSAYQSGALCLSLGGESDGLEMLSTGLFSAFIGSLSSLTYNTDQPLMIQLRPQQAPTVDFKKDKGQGAELELKIPELEIDFYTVVDHRYARIFTLGADIVLPLGLKGSSNTLEVAIGDLANVIDPATVKVTNVEMVTKSQVESLVNSLPTLIGSLTGLLGDDLIPPIEIPEIGGLKIQFVGPGLTILEEGGKAAALGLFLNMDISPEDMGGIFAAMEPVITDLDIDIRNPSELRADIAALRRADKSFSYRDLMPTIVAHMDVTGVDLDPSELEFAYSINHGPWSFWQQGPAIVIDNPVLAAESKFDVRITARVAGNANTGSASDAEFSFVNDYSAPKVTLEGDGALVQVIATDNVYSREELTMQYRFNGGAWSQPGDMQNLDILPRLLEGAVAVDVQVADPSGNVRTVRRSFGASDKAASSAPNTSGNVAGDGCSTSQGNGGLAAVLALLALVFFRRRESGAGDGSVKAASPIYIGLTILTVLMLGIGSTGCKSQKVGSGECNPACDSSSKCDAGECVPLLCEKDSECAMNARCLDGQCVSEATCEYSDDCEYGHICKDGTCRPSECTTSDDCDASKCTAPELPFCDFDDYEQVEAGECVCSAGVELGRHGGWLNVLALDGGATTVALAYSEQYGDLIFGTLQEDGNFDWSFVDGIPDGPVTLPPTGLRDGIIAAGDEAGRYVSVVLDEVAGEPVLHMAYQYRENGASVAALRYARAERAGSAWAWTFVDVDTFDFSGMFPSVFLTKSSVGLGGAGDDVSSTTGVGIAYMVRDIAIADEGQPVKYYSSLNLAYALDAAPGAADEFVVSEIDQAESTVPCGGLCPSSTFCAEATNSCLSRASGCGECAETETCLKTDAGAACVVASVASNGGLSVTPRGVGLFTSTVVAQDGTIHVAYYDQVHGNLMHASAAIVNDVVGLSKAPTIIDGEAGGKSTGDVGRWTRIHELPSGGIVIFYEDAGQARLKAAVVQGNAVNIVVLDGGNYSADDNKIVQSNRVGSSVYSRELEAGGYELFYQDTTNGVVRRIEWTDLAAAPSDYPHAVFGATDGLARELVGDAGALEASKIAIANNDGAVGFFTNVVEGVGRTIFASKQIRSPRTGNTVLMHVTTGAVEHDAPVDDGEGDEAEAP